ncbi:MAG: FHA domain-containing protein [Chloroflexi bacterium]|nr:FHA domain-containing protein [Chloroflexota bacterium]MBP7045045.1 FHA domain-containing protein [Chloroflexota bacterium]
MLEKAYQLVIRKGPHAGQTILLVAPTLTLGRDPVADVVIDDAEVSRLHARLVETPDGYRLQDLGSTNGTFVDGRNISAGPILLEPDQEIQLGSSVVIAYQEIPDEAETDLVIEPAATMLEEPAESVEPVESVETGVDVVESVAVVSTAADTAVPVTAVPDTEPLVTPFTDPMLPPFEEPAEPLDQIEPAELIAPQTEPATEAESPLPDLADLPKFDPPPMPKATPRVIPAAEPVAPQPQTGGSSSKRIVSILAIVLLILMCCCCGFLVFMYQWGGDWVLRQMQMVP